MTLPNTISERPVVDLLVPEALPIAPPEHRTPELLRPTRLRVVVVGAGFGGLSVVRALAGKPVDVLLINRNNYHGFWPLLYQVASAGLEAESIAYPVRAIIGRSPNVQYIMAEVSGVDFDARLVQTDTGPISYDYLILAAGSTTNYFGNSALAEQTFGLKDLPEAEALRNQVLLCLEQAAHETDPARRRSLLTFVIVGGGPTGVELAGAFSELLRHVLRHDYPMLDRREARVILAEATDKILAMFPAHLQRHAINRLRRMGVELRLQSPLDGVQGTQVRFKDGTQLDAATVVWAAGVRAAELADALNVAQGRAARVHVTPTLQLPERPEVYVIGDMAYLEGYRPGVAYPMVAQVAIQMGQRAAQNILAHIQGRAPDPFRYFDKGQMATIGRRAAVLDAFGIQLGGTLAWLGWVFVHIMELVGFRNRLVVFANWVYNYLTYDRGIRLITGKPRRSGTI